MLIPNTDNYQITSQSEFLKMQIIIGKIKFKLTINWPIKNNLVEVTRVSSENPFSLVRTNEEFIRNEEFYSLATDLTHKISVPERWERYDRI